MVLIRTSTSPMTSVPKPLKFLRPIYPTLQELYETLDVKPTTISWWDFGVSLLAGDFLVPMKPRTRKYLLQASIGWINHYSTVKYTQYLRVCEYRQSYPQPNH